MALRWRVVLDTMVWAQAASARQTGRRSAPAEILDRALAGEYLLVSTPHIRDEFVRTLQDPWFAKRMPPLFDAAGFFDSAMSGHVMVEATGPLILVDHAKDDPILWATGAGLASHLVARENRLLHLGNFQHTLIVSPPAFLQVWRVPKANEPTAEWVVSMRETGRLRRTGTHPSP